MSERITASSINPCVPRTCCATLRIHKKQSLSILEKHSREKFAHLKTFSSFSPCSCRHRVFASWKQKGARGNLANGSEPETLPASRQRPLTRLLQGTSLVTLHRMQNPRYRRRYGSAAFQKRAETLTSSNYDEMITEIKPQIETASADIQLYQQSTRWCSQRETDEISRLSQAAVIRRDHP